METRYKSILVILTVLLVLLILGTFTSFATMDPNGTIITK
jgi:flagellar basal body-associated protein FliL